MLCLNQLKDNDIVCSIWKHIAVRKSGQVCSDACRTQRKFTRLAKGMWSLFNTANEECDEDVRVYFLSHTEESESGTVKMKTLGKLLDDKITMEGMVTVVLRALKTTDKYYFSTQNNGRDTCKSPKGMFDELEIPNDLAYVDEKICSYYDIKETKTKKENK